jgi:YD repeat-containing protein
MGLARLPDGGITQSFDNANGAWAYAYDGFDRLAGAVSASSGYGCAETYDRYGNRLAQSAFSGYSCPSTPNFSPSGNHDNRLAGFGYNNAGAILNDGLHSYSYDAQRVRKSSTSPDHFLRFEFNCRERVGVATMRLI